MARSVISCGELEREGRRPRALPGAGTGLQLHEPGLQLLEHVRQLLVAVPLRSQYKASHHTVTLDVPACGGLPSSLAGYLLLGPSPRHHERVVPLLREPPCDGMNGASLSKQALLTQEETLFLIET